MTAPMVPIVYNGRWPILLPAHRAALETLTTGWERERLDSMHANIRPGDVVYDVGAEEADISALCAMWARQTEGAAECGDPLCGGPVHQSVPCQRPGGVVLFEPNPKVWPNIRATFDGNDLPVPLACIVGFAGDEARLVAEHGDLKAWPSCAFGEVITDHGFCQLNERPDMPSLPIDHVASVVAPPDVITIDSEGSEFHVLRGAESVLTNVRPLVYVSIHPDFMIEQYGQRASDLHRYMSQLGYVPQELAVDHEIHVAFEHPDGRRLK